MKTIFVGFCFLFLLVGAAEYDDDECLLEFLTFADSFKAKDPRAMELYDTWGKLPVSIPHWNTVLFGNYERCLEYNQLLATDPYNVTVQGQYCFVKLNIKLNISEPTTTTSTTPSPPLKFIQKQHEINEIPSFDVGFNSAFCVPTSCSPEITVDYLYHIFLETTMFLPISAECQTAQGPIEVDAVDIATFSIFAIFFVLIIASTIYDVSQVTNLSIEQPNELFSAFSIYRNGQRLFDMTKSANSINCLHGLRAFSILWIMFGHRFSNQLNFPLRVPYAVAEFYQHVYSVILSSYSIAVDTFFLMAALLLTISTLRAIDKNRLNIPRMILHRYLRYTPVLAVAILCTISFSKFLVSGPLQSASSELRENCVNYWWSALLHIQNYVNPDNLCLNHSWYLAVDFQLFVITPFLILGIKKFRSMIWVIPGLIAACSVYIFTISMVLEIYKHPRSVEGGNLYHRLIYHPTHARIQSWLVGMALGFLFQHKDELKLKINKFLDAFLWIVSLSTLFATIFLSYLFVNPVMSFTTSLLSNALFMSLHRIFWSLALSYIIFACEHLQSGSIIRQILSSTFWKPIGTKGLSLYITHLIFMLFMIMNIQQPYDFTLWNMVHTYSGDLLPCFIIAIIFYLAFEAPIMIVENYLYKKITRQ